MQDTTTALSGGATLQLLKDELDTLSNAMYKAICFPDTCPFLSSNPDNDINGPTLVKSTEAVRTYLEGVKIEGGIVWEMKHAIGCFKRERLAPTREESCEDNPRAAWFRAVWEQIRVVEGPVETWGEISLPGKTEILRLRQLLEDRNLEAEALKKSNRALTEQLSERDSSVASIGDEVVSAGAEADGSKWNGSQIASCVNAFEDQIEKNRTSREESHSSSKCSEECAMSLATAAAITFYLKEIQSLLPKLSSHATAHADSGTSVQTSGTAGTNMSQSNEANSTVQSGSPNPITARRIPEAARRD